LVLFEFLTRSMADIDSNDDRLRFSLRALLIVITIAGILFGYFRFRHLFAIRFAFVYGVWGAIAIIYLLIKEFDRYRQRRRELQLRRRSDSVRGESDGGNQPGDRLAKEFTNEEKDDDCR